MSCIERFNGKWRLMENGGQELDIVGQNSTDVSFKVKLKKNNIYILNLLK